MPEKVNFSTVKLEEFTNHATTRLSNSDNCSSFGVRKTIVRTRVMEKRLEQHSQAS